MPTISVDTTDYPLLARACFTFPAIDNHAHNICKGDVGNIPPIESVSSEASDDALDVHAETSLAGMTAVAQLAELYNCDATWTDVKRTVRDLTITERCQKCFAPSGIQMLLLDDLLSGVQQICHDYRWHDSFTLAKTKRIVRLEVLMENSIRSVFLSESSKSQPDLEALEKCAHIFIKEVRRSIEDPEVVSFKSIICYRSGLDVLPSTTAQEALVELQAWLERINRKIDAPALRLNEETKSLNDWLLLKAFREISTHPREEKRCLPVQFHVGLGDKSVRLPKSRPSYLQSFIEEFPEVPIVLLHSCYPFTQEAGYMAAVYRNVYLDFGEIFPMISTSGQHNVLRQMLEVCPASKLLWSTDGHFHPEGFYLASIQTRKALYEVMKEMIKLGSILESQACDIIRRLLFANSNELYQLGLSGLA